MTTVFHTWIYNECSLEENESRYILNISVSILGIQKRGEMAPPLFPKNIIPLFLLLNGKYQELQSACGALGMPLDHINHIHQSM